MLYLSELRNKQTIRLQYLLIPYYIQYIYQSQNQILPFGELLKNWFKGVYPVP